MNDLLKQRIARLLDSLGDERGYEILDYIEFLDSKYAERSRPSGILARMTETVEDTMRAGELPDPGHQRHDGHRGQRGQGHEGPGGGRAGGGRRGREGGRRAAGSPRSRRRRSRNTQSQRRAPGSPPHPTTRAPHGRFCAGSHEYDLVRIRVHPRHRAARGDLARRGLDDRVGDLHRLRRHRPPGGRLGARRAAPGLDRDRRDDGHRRAGVRRAGRDDAARRAASTSSCARDCRRWPASSTAGRSSPSSRPAPSRLLPWPSRDSSASSCRA